MDIPQTFLDDLDVEFQGRLRARFSGMQQAVIIEQKVGRNILPSLKRDRYTNERRQSLAEGYMPIMTVSVSEKVRCPECNYWLEVPNRETKQIRCFSCKLKGRTSLIIAGYFPLNSFLINHLKEIDPVRNMDKDMTQELDRQNERKAELMQRQLSNDAESYASDNLNQLMGIPTFGYTSKKLAGTDVKGF